MQVFPAWQVRTVDVRLVVCTLNVRLAGLHHPRKSGDHRSDLGRLLRDLDGYAELARDSLRRAQPAGHRHAGLALLIAERLDSGDEDEVDCASATSSSSQWYTSDAVPGADVLTGDALGCGRRPVGRVASRIGGNLGRTTALASARQRS
jgi:hypothetical protein